MRTLLLPDADLLGHAATDTPLVPGREVEQRLRRVLRLGDGAELRVSDGRGHFALARLEPEGLRLSTPTTRPAPLPVRLCLGCGWIEGERMDWLVEKATELGADRIVPLELEHAVVRLDGARAERRRERLQAVADAAFEQSGRSHRCRVATSSALATLLRASPGNRVLFADEAGGAPVAEALEGVDLAASDREAAELLLLVGSEGGWEAGERAQLLAAGARPVGLGPAILRAETAALALVLRTTVALGG